MNYTDLVSKNPAWAIDLLDKSNQVFILNSNKILNKNSVGFSEVEPITVNNILIQAYKNRLTSSVWTIEIWVVNKFGFLYLAFREKNESLVALVDLAVTLRHDLKEWIISGNDPVRSIHYTTKDIKIVFDHGDGSSHSIILELMGDYFKLRK